MDIGSTIQQQSGGAPSGTHNGTMEWRTARPVTAIEQRCVNIEQLADALDVVQSGGLMDRMIRAGCYSSPAVASLFENPGNGFMTAITRHIDKAAIVETIPFGVYACA